MNPETHISRHATPAWADVGSRSHVFKSLGPQQWTPRLGKFRFPWQSLSASKIPPQKQISISENLGHEDIGYKWGTLYFWPNEIRERGRGNHKCCLCTNKVWTFSMGWNGWGKNDYRNIILPSHSFLALLFPFAGQQRPWVLFEALCSVSSISKCVLCISQPELSFPHCNF